MRADCDSTRAVILGIATVATLASGMLVSSYGAPFDPLEDMKGAGFSEAQLASVRTGAAVSRIVLQRDDNAAFITGVVRVVAPAHALAQQVRRIEDFEKGGRTLQIGRFGTPPTLADLQPLVVENDDLAALRGCKVGDCDVKMGREAIEAMRAIDWRSAAAPGHAAGVTKQMLLAQVRAYLEEGSTGMVTYHDNRRPESVAAAFEQILRDSPRMVSNNPPFYRYLLEFPRGEPPPALESFFYWSKVRMRKAVVSLVQVCLAHREERGRTTYWIAKKHLYDSHYFLGYAEFLTAVPDPGGGPGFYLVRSIKALIDPPRGWLRGLLLGRIKAAMREQLTRDLQRTKAQLESLAEGR